MVVKKVIPLCEAGFESLVKITSKYWNTMDARQDIKLALSKIKSRISKLVELC